MTLPDKSLTEAEAAEFLHLQARTLQSWRYRRPPCGPKFLAYSSRAVRYRLSDLVAWQNSRAVETVERPD
jgi:hypothetical protein